MRLLHTLPLLAILAGCGSGGGESAPPAPPATHSRNYSAHVHMASGSMLNEVDTLVTVTTPGDLYLPIKLANGAEVTIETKIFGTRVIKVDRDGVGYWNGYTVIINVDPGFLPWQLFVSHGNSGAIWKLVSLHRNG